MVSVDDSFSYAIIARDFFESWQYHLDSWAAANMPSQIIFAVGLAKVFGFSLGILRVSTLILFAVGLIAFYRLLMDFGSTDRVATMATLGLLCSPPVLLLSFSFMTDVQFLSWMVVALWLYTRGIRSEAISTMLLASFAAAAAIGTRQFGLALLAGLGVVYLLKYRSLRSLPLFLAGAFIPSLVMAWQLWSGVAEPSFAQIVRLCEQSAYWHQELPNIGGEIVWRATVILEYIALFLLPLAPLALFLLRRRLATTPDSTQVSPLHLKTGARLDRWVLCVCIAFVALGLLYAGLYPADVDGVRVQRHVT